MSVLRSVIRRLAAIVRGCGVGYVAAQVAIWHGYYAAQPGRLAGPLAAMAWGIAAVAWLRRRRPDWPLIVVDTGFYAALAVSTGACVPPEMRGVAGNWLYIAVASQVVVTVWFAPRVLAVLLSLVPEAAYWAGTAVTPPGPAQGNAPVVSGVLLLVVVMGHWTARGMLYRRAARADARFAAADQEAHDQYVVLSRSIERREHERLLHDTVLNTLTAISRGSSGPALVARCRQDIARLEHALTDPGDPAGPPVRGGGSLVADLDAIAAEMRGRGLRVHLGREAGPDGAEIPAPVAGALVHATREALANVAAHAGTGEAWVSVTQAAQQLRVTVRDEGAGFDLARVDPGRLGLRRSITERVTDWGGRVRVQSAPGQGTLVSMSWPAATAAAEPDLVAADSSW